MEEAWPRPKVPGRGTSKSLQDRGCSVLNLRDVIKARRLQRLGMSDPDPAAGPSNVVHMRRGPRPGRRGRGVCLRGYAPTSLQPT